MTAIPMPPALRDETSRAAMERVSRTEGEPRLWVPILTHLRVQQEARPGNVLVAMLIQLAESLNA